MPLTAETQSRIRFALASNPAGAELISALLQPFFDSGNTVYTAAGNFVMAVNQIVAFVKKAAGAATQVTLPASPALAQVAIVVDAKGDAATNNITVVPAAGTIDGAASVLIQTNYGAISLVYNGTEWNVVNSYNMAGGANLTVPGFLLETAADTITAFATGGQAGAVPLTKQQNRISTVATAGDSVLLPVSVAGMEVTIVNSGANPCQVFGAGADTINGVATATGVSQPANSVVEYSCITAGSWFAEGIGVGFSGSLFTESAADNITAHAGGGQASAFLLTMQTSRITTVTSVGDSVKLPVSAPGLELVVMNHGVNAMQVYGSGTDTIDDVATATGVSQMKGSVCIYTCTTAGAWYTEGLGTGYSGTLQTLSFANTLTAHAGGGQGAALAMTATINRITTVASAGDSVLLPASAGGLGLTLINAGANPMQVFGNGADTINGVAAATGVSQMPNSVVNYVTLGGGIWLTEGIGTGFSGSLQTLSYTTGLTAHAGGGQASALALTGMMNRISTVATAADSVALPVAQPGMQVTIDNRGANPCQVFGAGTDTINSIATATGISQGVNAIVTYQCFVAGNWEVALGGATILGLSTLSVNGAIPPHTAHTYVITKAGVLADTLAAPTSGTDDGIVITVTSNTANAHTITASGLLQTGSASVNVATFAANAGATLSLMAYQGKWNVLSQVGITFS